MTDNSVSTAPPGPSPGRALLTAAAILAGSVLLAVIGGLLWASFAPRVQYQMYSLNPPTAYAVNPETSAFIAADGWYCLIAVVGGALIGLLGYLAGVRRYGPVPMAAVVAGATGAGFLVAWLGHQWSGGPGFDRLLATTKPGTFLYAPVSLGSHGAIAFWPLAAAAVAGGLELFGVMRTRPRAGDTAPMPGLDSFGWPQQPGRHRQNGAEPVWSEPGPADSLPSEPVPSEPAPPEPGQPDHRQES